MIELESINDVGNVAQERVLINKSKLDVSTHRLVGLSENIAQLTRVASLQVCVWPLARSI